MKKYAADLVLQQWGLWIRQGGVSLGYKSPAAALIDDHLQVGGLEQPWIGEEYVGLCDRIVTRLATTNRLCAEVLIMHYGSPRTQHGIGLVLGITRRRVGELLEAGQMYVQSELDARAVAWQAS